MVNANVFDGISNIDFDWNLDWIFEYAHDVEGAAQECRYQAEDLRIHPTTPASVPQESYQQPLNVEDTGIFVRSQIPRDESNNRLDSPWPTEWQPVPERITTIPALGDPDQNRLNDLNHLSLPPLRPIAISNLHVALSQLEHSPWQPVLLDGFPSQEKLDHCIDLYFKRFDWVTF